MFSVMKKLALVAVFALTTTGAFAHGDHGAAKPECCKAKAAGAQACAAGAQGCPMQAAANAALPECCQKTAAGNKQECCAKHAAGQRQPCCEKHTEVSAAPSACCMGKPAAAAATATVPAGNLSPSMQSLMQKVDELRRRRQ